MPIPFDPIARSGGLDANRERSPLPAPDFVALDRMMWNADAPYEMHAPVPNAVGLYARGRAAMYLGCWVLSFLADPHPPPDVTATRDPPP